MRQREWNPRKRKQVRLVSIQSTTGHEEPGGKQGGPPSKAKYYETTDREKYREGKVKRPPGGEWKEPETVCLQTVEALYMCDGVPIEEWTGELLYVARLSGKTRSRSESES